MLALGLMISEKIFEGSLELFSSLKHWSVANLDPIGMISRVYVGDN